MFVDETCIIVKAGHGGSGAVAFFGPKGKPCGGNGGDGGSIYAVVNPNITHLRKYLEKSIYQAENGKIGGANKRHGANAKNLELPMPIGTTIIDLATSEEVEMNNNNPKVLLCRGGRGGLGNDAFKSSTKRGPTQYGLGGKGQERNFKLILKLIANYGLIGLPNAGKSSLLNLLTSAHAKVAEYQFTTLEPNLGVISNGKVIADIPGLIKGASHGKGLGIKFLKHIEKVDLLLHCISSEIDNIEETYKTVKNELGQYNIKMLDKKEIILLTKVDLLDKQNVERKIKLLKKLNPKVITVSAYDDKSVKKLLLELIR